MIPASYLFKDAFQKTWYEPDVEAAIERQHRPGGLTRLAGLRSWLKALMRRPASQPGAGAIPASDLKL